MLDAYIIDRIRREREQAQRRSSQVPLYIEDPTQAETPEEPSERHQRPQDRRRQDREMPDRGTVVIDYHL